MIKHLLSVLIISCCFITFSNDLTFAQDTLSLHSAVKTALENNLSIYISGNDLKIAKNNNSIGNAGFLPVLDLNAQNNNSVNNSRQLYYNGDLREVSNAGAGSVNAGALLNWTIFDGMNMFVTAEKLKIIETISEIQLKITIENVVSEIMSQYLLLVSQQAVLKYYREAASISAERKAIAFSGKQLGSASGQDYLQACVDLNNDSSRLLIHENLIINTKAKLNMVMARAPDYPFEVNNETITEFNLEFTDIWEKTLNQNSELKVIRQNYMLSETDIKSARSKLLPRIDLFGGYNYSNSVSQSGLVKESRSYGPVYGVSASLRLFNGGNEKRHIMNSKIMIDSREAVVKETILYLNTIVFQTYNQLTQSKTLIKTETENLKIAKENVLIAKERYKLGNLSGIELREAQNKLLNAEINLETAKYNAGISSIELLRLSGQLLQD